MTALMNKRNNFRFEIIIEDSLQSRTKRRKHEGVRYPCNQCEYSATTGGNLRVFMTELSILCNTARKSYDTHTECTQGIHDPCTQRNYSATTVRSLKMHIKSVHEGVGFPCTQRGYSLQPQLTISEDISVINTTDFKKTARRPKMADLE